MTAESGNADRATAGCEAECCDLLTEGLDPAAQAIVAEAFAHLWRGVAPSFADLGDGIAAAAIFAGLSRIGRCELDEHDRVIGVHGLTQRPTGHRILGVDRDRYTWCGFDAIGIPAALGIDAVVSTSCPHCSTPVDVAIAGGEPQDTGAVVWLPSAIGGHLIADFCSRTNVFCSDDHLARWRAIDGGEGEAVTVLRAAEVGRETWSDVARGTAVWEGLTP